MASTTGQKVSDVDEIIVVTGYRPDFGFLSEVRLDLDPGDGAFTAWYGREGRTVGVLTHERDEDYERARERVERGDPLP